MSSRCSSSMKCTTAAIEALAQSMNTLLEPKRHQKFLQNRLHGVVMTVHVFRVLAKLHHAIEE
eukprot:2669669-Amphidinium_carterae.1